MPETSKTASVLLALTWIAIAALPLSLVYVFLDGAAQADRLASAFPEIAISQSLGDAARYGAVAVGLIPACAALYLLWQMQALFRLYRRGTVLTAAAAVRISRLGVGLLALSVITVASRTAQILILTSSNAPGARVLAIQLGASDVALVLAGGLMIVIGAAMAAAAAMAEDHAQIV